MSTAKRRRLDQDVASNGSTSRATTSRQRAVAAASKAQAVAASGKHANYGDSGPYVPVLSLSTLPVSALSRYALHYGLIPPEPLTPAQATHPTPALPLELKPASSSLVPSVRRADFIPPRRHRVLLQNGQYAFEDTLGQQLGAAGQHRDGSAAAMAIDGADGHASTSNGGAAEGFRDINSNIANEHGQSTNPPSASSSSEARAGQPISASAEHTANEAQEQEWEDPGEPDAEELRGMTAFDGGVDQFKARLGKLATAHWDRINTVKEGETIINFAYAVRMRSKILKSVPAS